MIGDALFDCGESLDHYLQNYEWPQEVKGRIRRLLNEIRETQRWIDRGEFELLQNVRPAADGIASMLANGTGYPPRHSAHQN